LCTIFGLKISGALLYLPVHMSASAQRRLRQAQAPAFPAPPSEGSIPSIPSAADLHDLYQQSWRGSSAQVTSAAERIAKMIRDGQLAPGQRLIENDLSETLNLARGRVREALRILAGNGMVELIPSRGARVSSLSRADLTSIMQALLGIVIMGIELFGQAHGKPSARLAQALVDANDRIAVAADSGNLLDLSARLTEYHVLVNHMSGNKILNMLISKLNISSYEMSLAHMFTPDYSVVSKQRYSLITRHLLDGRAEDASRILKDMSASFANSLAVQGG
jgi:DNA-binding GntR family transcriptional regulator